jgi:carboxypeptidase Q
LFIFIPKILCKMKLIALLVQSIILFISGACAQDPDSIVISNFFNKALQSDEAYRNLEFLCKNAKGRMIGTPQMTIAIEYTRQVMDQMGLDTVFLQPVMGPGWKPGDVPVASVSSGKLGNQSISVLPLGNSVPTPPGGIQARIVEVKGLDDLERLGKDRIKGNIVFYNRPMDSTLLNTFAAYGGAADQRVRGASMASRYGAVAVIVRSLTTATDHFPHTGMMRYDEGIEKIPALAICTADANLLDEWLQKDPDTRCSFTTNCQVLPQVPCYNVIGEIRGSQFPGEFITIGGHLDAWSNTEGAQDDGAGCVHSLEAIRLFRELGIRPKHSIRVVMFMDEELSQTGGIAYAKAAGENNERHILALESDRGGFAPRGFGFSANGKTLETMVGWKKYFEPYGIHEFARGGGGTDIGPLAKLGAITCGFIPDWQRYFDYHHSANDTFASVNKRELQLGCAAIASFIYLCDKLEY